MTTLPVKQGIDGIPTATIPTDPAAFIDWFKNSFLPRWAANADIRNATGVRIAITGNPSTNATLSLGNIPGTSVLGNPTGSTAQASDIAASADGQYLQRVSGVLEFAPLSIAVADSITGAGTAASPLKLLNDAASPALSSYYGTDAFSALGYHALPTGGGTSNKQIFTQAGGVSQSYVVPLTATFVQVICVGGGGGGGSGTKQASGVSCGGGGGGGAGSISYATFLASDLGVSQTVAFGSGTGGIGGPAQTTSSTSGTIGTAGTTATFGTRLIAGGGAAGNGGAAGSGGNPGVGSTAGLWQAGTQGGVGGVGGSAGTAGASQNNAGFTSTNYCCTGGGGGGGANIAPAGFAGGAGGSGSQFMTLVGGTAGTSGGGTGGSGANGSGIQPASGGGGGGGAVGTTNGGPGGPGGNYGGGGGGGGSCLNTAAQSGAGGAGGPAAVICIAW